MCLLRVLGKPEAAERLHADELPGALAQAGWTESDEAYQTLYRKEEERAADAAALAELLAPLLTAVHVPRAVPAEAPIAEVVAFEEPPGAPRPQVKTAPSIADLIDGMLAQAREPRRGRKS